MQFCCVRVQLPLETRILAVVRYVRNLKSADDLDSVANDIFK